MRCFLARGRDGLGEAGFSIFSNVGLINKPLPLIGIIIWILIFRLLNGGGVLIMGLH